MNIFFQYQNQIEWYYLCISNIIYVFEILFAGLLWCKAQTQERR